MKFLSYLLFSVMLICATSCNKDEDVDKDLLINSGLVATWNLTETSGGFVGLSCQYQPGEVVFVFDAEDNLSITANIINNSAICGGQEIGVSLSGHTYGVLDHNDKKYLLIDDNEIGEIVVSDDQFTLNQNNNSSGSGADGFFQIFNK